MVPPDPISIEPLTLADVPQAMDLVAAANWNQTPRDWQRMIEAEPDGCFRAVSGQDIAAGQLVGTVTSTVYGHQLAWIGMMLVAAEQRRRGIGTRLMQRVIDYLRGRDIPTIKLDATPAGQPLYEQLGFCVEHTFQRWKRAAGATSGRPSEPSAGSIACEPDRFEPDRFEPDRVELGRYKELDREAFGVDRRQWLGRVARDCRVVGHQRGFGMLRAGRTAAYLGPITSEDPASAAAIVDELLVNVSDAVIWDCPAENPAAAALARQLHFEPVRELTRMWIGQPLRPRSPQHLFALCDPATG